MRIEITRDADHRVAPAVVQAFKAGSVVNVPKDTAEALIAQGAAKPAAPAAPTAHTED